MRYPPLGQRGGAGTTRAAGYGSVPWNEHVQSSNREILLTVMTEDLKGIADIEAIAALDGVDLISLGPTDLSTALGITDPKDPRLRQTVEELVAKVNRIGKAKVYLPVYHAAFYLTPQELVQMGASYTSVAPPPPRLCSMPCGNGPANSGTGKAEGWCVNTNAHDAGWRGHGTCGAVARHCRPCLSARVLAYLCIRQVAEACAITRQLCLQSGLLALGFRRLALGFCHLTLGFRRLALGLDGDLLRCWQQCPWQRGPA